MSTSTERENLTWLRRGAAGPLVVAHRGASAESPENTLAAFRLAIEQGATVVECDVHLSSDGVPVVIHDATVDRTTDGRGEITALTLTQLKTLDAGSRHAPDFAGERIPTLAETLALCAGRARVFVELKRGGGQELVSAALEQIERSSCEVAVISFGPEEVAGVARARPEVPLGFLVTKGHVRQYGTDRVLATARQLGAGFISPQHDVADAAFVAAAREAVLPVSVWTVDEPDRMRALAGLGVDAITTNRPAVALGLFA